METTTTTTTTAAANTPTLTPEEMEAMRRERRRLKDAERRRLQREAKDKASAAPSGNEPAPKSKKTTTATDAEPAGQAQSKPAKKRTTTTTTDASTTTTTTKKKKKADTDEPEGAAPRKKQRREEPAAAPRVQQGELGVSHVLHKARRFVNMSGVFETMVLLAGKRDDEQVNKAIVDFHLRTPSTYATGATKSATQVFMEWVRTNSAVFLRIAEVLQYFVRAYDTQSEDVRADFDAIVKHALEKDDDAVPATSTEVPDKDDMVVLGGVDDDVLSFLRELGADIPATARGAPALRSDAKIRLIAVQTDAVFPVILEHAFKMKALTSRFLDAVEKELPAASSIEDLLLCVARVHPECKTVEDRKRIIGQYVAAFAWIFPNADV